MRNKTKPSTAKCNLDIYTLFLLSEPKYVSCMRLSQIMEDLSHDSINRFLWRENYTPEDLFKEVVSQIELEEGTISVDDMVIDKPYIERFHVRETTSITTHIFGAIRAFVYLEFLRFQGQIINWYSLKRELVKQI